MLEFDNRLDIRTRRLSAPEVALYWHGRAETYIVVGPDFECVREIDGAIKKWDTPAEAAQALAPEVLADLLAEKPSEEIYSPRSAYGGWEFRVMSNNKAVEVQAKKPGNEHYATTQKLTLAQWRKVVEVAELNDPYRTDPAVIASLSDAGYARFIEMREDRMYG